MRSPRTNADPTGIQADASSTGPAAPRSLTYDEKKAAEAAFRGEPFNSSWSAAARRVYDGILIAKGVRALETLVEKSIEAECAVR